MNKFLWKKKIVTRIDGKFRIWFALHLEQWTIRKYFRNSVSKKIVLYEMPESVSQNAAK